MKSKTIATMMIIFLLFTLLSACKPTAAQQQMSDAATEANAGWIHYEIDHISFQLPDSYTDMTVQAKKNDPQNSENLLFIAARTDETNAFIETNIAIGIENLSTPTTLDDYMIAYLNHLTDNFQYIHSEELPSNGYPIGKVVTSINTPEAGAITQTVYFIFVGNNMYQIVFSNVSATYESNQPEFEEIIEKVDITRDDTSETIGENNQGLVCLVGIFFILVAIVLNAWLKRKRRTDDITPLILPEDF